jgi:NTE family protein
LDKRVICTFLSNKISSIWTRAAVAVCTIFSIIAPASFGADEDMVATAWPNASDFNKFKSAERPASPKVGLALGGGGFRGPAEVGVLEVLEKEGIKFDYIAGTSIGSIIGGLWDAGVPLSTLKRIFEDGKASREFMPVPLFLVPVVEPFMLSMRLLGIRQYDGLYPGKFLRKYLTKMTPDKYQDIKDLPVPFAAVTFDLTSAQPYMIRGGSLAYAMCASSAVPGLRQPVRIGDKLFVDGGVANNLPVKQCRQMGADIVVAVSIDAPVHKYPPKKFRRIGSVSDRLLNWNLSAMDKDQEQLADIVIRPDTIGVGLIIAHKKTSIRAYEAGRKAAEAALPEIRQKLKGTRALADASEQIKP